MRAPDELSDAARAIWDHVTRTHPHLTEADSVPLTRYCWLQAQWFESAAEVEDGGRVKVSEKGGEYLAAAMNAVLGIGQQVIRLERELGIVSSARPDGSRVPELGTVSRGKSLRSLRITECGEASE